MSGRVRAQRWLCLLAFCWPASLSVAQDAAGGDAPATPLSESSAPEAPPGSSMSLAEIDAALDALVAAAGESGRIETIGESRGGHALRVLVLSRAPGAASGARPALLLLDASSAGATHGAEAVLAVGRHLIERMDSAPYDELLAERTVLLAPALDPDARSFDDAVHFDQNFPFGWLPESLRAGSGRYPLSESAARVVASWLGEQRALALVVAVRDADGLTESFQPWPGAALPLGDREVLERLCRSVPPTARLRLMPWGRLGSPGGGVLDHVYQGRGIFAAAWTAPARGAAGEEIAAWTDELVGRTAELLQQLPRLTLALDAREELIPGVWRIDVALRNAGPLPTLSELGASRVRAGEFRLALEGATLLAIARREAHDPSFRVVGFHDGSDEAVLGDGVLGGGESLGLRLVLEAQAGSELRLGVRSERAGAATLALTLE